MTKEPFLIKDGWKLYRHPAFDEVFEALVEDVRQLELSNPETYKSHPKAKLLARIFLLITEEIPANPKAPEYLQGNTLGRQYRHWYRAKFLRRFRLFFRFSTKSKIIIYAWVNDESTLRKAGAKTDPYAVFVKRLKAGNPPDNWDVLLSDCEEE